MPSPIVINANFIDLTGNAVSGYMQAAIVSPTGVYDLYVTGTGIIVPKLSTSGIGTAVAVSIWGNDVVVDMVDGLKDTYYTVTLFNTSNIAVWTAAYSFTGAGPINLVGYPSLTVVPAATSGSVPTNILTSNNVFTGTNVFNIPIPLTSLALWNSIAKTTTYTAIAGDVVLANTTGGGFTITLPLSSSNKNQAIRVKKTSSDGNTVTVGISGGDLIDGASTKTFTSQYTSIDVIADGSGNWWIT